MIIDPIHIDTNIKDWRTTVIGLVFLVIGIVFAALPLVLVSQDLNMDATLFQEVQDYARWAAWGFVILGLMLIGIIRSSKQPPKTE